ncbi:NAD-dependent succinate-semialdehyde dehydrogenase [Undibacterium rugosum]|uniref:NAD-dependent succinate-semialdehyde dehydrogenase n=1 Tax=Undibacterium rugosum TaxID=2762291 RepID=A0A923KZE5_9BURK|nr:NAD-dependent succinate-semialdehyde dehydrogenase [Undibacterium rugosum]MBC3935913.1 NAD-dependent succinate-semialdehyde dehydrogenase [Undibacterium rugosum]MBR7779304.1 NAD-dependent succinate-semialdehyde dehydrogenase [Undibacterium rugosum]
MLPLLDPSLFRQQAYINGKWSDAESDKKIAVHNPATGALLGHVPNMNAIETRRAIAASNVAWQGWRSMLAKERSLILRRWQELMLEHCDDLAAIMTAEQGKSLTEARGEIAYAASYLEWFAEEAKRMYGDTIPTSAKGKRILVTKEPIGVCAAITPWNFPSAMIARKVGPALAAGCCMIVKPASLTPFSALALAELAHRAGVPPGVFNVVTGNAAAIGGEITANPLVRKLSFTGSTEVGRQLMRDSANSIKKLSLELGGNAPFIVFDDADLDAAVEGVLTSKYRNSGQTCVCVNRIYVQDGVYDVFTGKLVDAVKKNFKVGNGVEAGVNQGPLINESAVRNVETQIADALAKGARVLVGGQRHALGGNFFEPTVLADVTQDMRFAHEETFGPVAPIFRFKSDTEVVAMANDTDCGLASYFYSRDIGRIWRVAEQLEYGMVGINTGLISTEVAPFGGVKQSGLGREGSKYGVDDYLIVKYWCLAGI